jgi:hypothetical protein
MLVWYCRGSLAEIRAKNIGSGHGNGLGGVERLCINRDLYCSEENVSLLTI